MKHTYTVDINQIQVIGYIWMPNNVVRAYKYTLEPYDMDNIGEPTRENVEAWLAMNAGDFSNILDFYAEVGETLIPWSSEESELTYQDCIYPSED